MPSSFFAKPLSLGKLGEHEGSWSFERRLKLIGITELMSGTFDDKKTQTLFLAYVLEEEPHNVRKGLLVSETCWFQTAASYN